MSQSQTAHRDAGEAQKWLGGDYVHNRTADLVSDAIVDRLKPVGPKVKTLSIDKCKEFCGYCKPDEALGRTFYLKGPLHVGSEAPTRISSAYYAKTSLSSGRWNQ